MLFPIPLPRASRINSLNQNQNHLLETINMENQAQKPSVPHIDVVGPSNTNKSAGNPATQFFSEMEKSTNCMLTAYQTP